MVKCKVKSFLSSFLFFIQFILVSNAVPLTDPRNVTESSFSYIGSYKEQKSTARLVNEADYYVSANSATWANALTDCKNYFGPFANMVAMETEGEWQFLKKHLENYSGTRYWTSGTFDPSTYSWRWTTNGQPLPFFAPWAKGYPNNPRSILCVLIYRINQFDASWLTEVNTRMERFICEVPGEQILTAPFNNNELPDDTMSDKNDIPDDIIPYNTVFDNSDVAGDTVFDNDDTVLYNTILPDDTSLDNSNLPVDTVPCKNELSDKETWLLLYNVLYKLFISDSGEYSN